LASLIVGVVETSISAAEWTAITVPSTVSANAFIGKCRDGASFLISNESNGSGYMTIPLSIKGNLPQSADNIVFYVKGTSTTTFELALIRNQ